MHRNTSRRGFLGIVAGAAALVALPRRARASTVIADGGVSDQTGPVNDAFRSGTPLPAGTIRVTAPVGLVSNANYANGGALIGAPGFQTTLIGDFDSDGGMNRALVQIDTQGAGKYSVGTRIQDVILRPATGRSLNGISLTAAWMTTIDRVWLPNGFVNGVMTPWRPDINPSLSDVYQCWSLKINQCFVQQCAGNGFDLAAGQSPGGLYLGYSQAIQCKGIGVRISQGQNEITNNVISYNGLGGLEIDTVEGPAQMGRILLNEIQDNWGWGISVRRSRNLQIRGNRFLSEVYSSSDWAHATPLAQTSGGTFMPQFVHVNIGSAGDEAWNLVCEGNQHKTANGSTATSLQCIGYDAGGNVLSSSFPSQFIKNEFGFRKAGGGFDGISQNSSGFIPYVNIAAPAGIIIDP